MTSDAERWPVVGHQLTQLTQVECLYPFSDCKSREAIRRRRGLPFAADDQAERMAGEADSTESPGSPAVVDDVGDEVRRPPREIA